MRILEARMLLSAPSLGIEGGEYATHRKVNIGETAEPFCAARAPEESLPSTVGERHITQIPHQQSIL
jgi:hypothetical protein